MRTVLQRVSSASVRVENDVLAKIDQGIVLLLGILEDDSQEDIKYIIEKAVNLRIFEDEDDKMNLSILDIDAKLLIVPNFTIYGDARKGRRPSFSGQASIETAEKLFEEVKEYSKKYKDRVLFGVFQADMQVEIINDGPVTLILDSKKML